MAFDTLIDSAKHNAAMTATADAIREKTGETGKIVWDELTGYSSAIGNIQSGGGTGDLNLKVYTGEITEICKGTEDTHVVLVRDAFLAEHRNDATLFVRVEFDVDPTAYTIVKNWAVNTVLDVIPNNSTSEYQFIHRWGSDGSRSLNVGSTPLNSDAPAGVGCLQITADGELRCYPKSGNYAVRPSKYTVKVEW